jgi:hypothetical protein
MEQGKGTAGVVLRQPAVLRQVVLDTYQRIGLYVYETASGSVVDGVAVGLNDHRALRPRGRRGMRTCVILTVTGANQRSR